MIIFSHQDYQKQLDEEIPGFLQTLAVPNQTGRFLPCVKEVTPEGRKASLGFSCFALKLYYMLGLWEKLNIQKRTEWVHFLKSFQTTGNPKQNRVTPNAFIDPPVVAYLERQELWYQRLAQKLFHPRKLTYLQMVIIAETKQTLATLLQVGETAEHPYRGFPLTPTDIRDHILGLDWTMPWGAGGQASAIAVLLKVEGPKLLPSKEVHELLNVCCQIFEHLTDKETGGYLTRNPPEYGQLINGAMKVLTALDWLNVPIHYPKQLIDTCLTRLPPSDGCHLVDAVYVLYRCLQQTQYRKAEIQKYCLQILDMIKQHHNADGGFSYHIGYSQKIYYRVPISQGFAESDIHGTILLTWALTMIFEILEDNPNGWRVIKP